MFHLWKKSIFARNYAHCRELASYSFLALEARNSPLRSGSNTNNITSNSQ